MRRIVVRPFDVLVLDPPWAFDDKLKMSDVKRGSEANYAVMRDEDIVNLGASVRGIMSDNSFCAMWFPGSKLEPAIAAFRSFGFIVKGIGVWVKGAARSFTTDDGAIVSDTFLSFGMGRYFRGACEPWLFGTRGKYQPLGSHSERNVIVAPKLPHSQKPEELQNRIERMYPDTRRLELFARRVKEGWSCCGLECPATAGEDVHTTIERLRKEIGG
jgi:N6-adenosine-specific RNA methylase IME4